MLTKIKYIYVMCSDTLPTSVERWDSKKKYNINYSTALVPNAAPILYGLKTMCSKTFNDRVLIVKRQDQVQIKLIYC